MDNKGCTQRLLTFVLAIVMSIVGLISPTSSLADDGGEQGIELVDSLTSAGARHNEESQEEYQGGGHEEVDEKQVPNGGEQDIPTREGGNVQQNAPPVGFAKEGEKVFGESLRNALGLDSALGLGVNGTANTGVAMLQAEGSGNPMRANVTILLDDDSDPIHVPESVTLKVIRIEGLSDAEVEGEKTFNLADDNVNVIENGSGKKYLQILDAWTEEDGIDTPSSGFEKRLDVEATGWKQGGGFGPEFTDTGIMAIAFIPTNPSVTGIHGGTLRYYPVSAYQQYTVSAVWEDGDNGASMPRDSNYAGYTNRFKFECTAGGGRVSEDGYLYPESGWTTTVELPVDWEGTPLSYDFRTRFSFNQISATNRYEVVDTVVDETNKTVQFHLKLVDDTDSVSIPVKVVWEDDEDSRGFRPSTLKVGVYTNQKTLSGGSPDLNNPLSEYVFTADESWEHTFTSISGTRYGTTYDYGNRLPRTDENGAPVEYTFVQNDMAYPQTDDTRKLQAYYFSQADDQPIVTFDGTNDVVLPYHLATMPSEISVTWDDDNNSAGDRPDSVTVNLPLTIGKDRYTNVYNPDPEATKTVQFVLTSDDADPSNPNIWKKRFNYTVISDEGYYCNPTEPITISGMTGYTSTLTTRQYKGYPVAGIDITSTRGQLTGSLTVTKTVSGTGADQNKAFQFTVNLGDGAINGEYGDMTFTNGVATFSLTHNQSVTATGLPAGISFSVSETPVANYEASWVNQTGTIAASTTMFSTCDNEFQTVDIPVQKEWDDNDNALNNRPSSVTYKLYSAVPSGANNRSDSEPTLVATQSATADDDYATTFSGLPAEDEHGNALVYCVGEDQVPGYALLPAYAPRGNGYDLYRVFDGTNPVNITNRKVQDRTFYLMKLWDDEGHEGARPAGGVTLHLYANGVEVATKNLTAADASNCSSSSPNYGNMWCDKVGEGSVPQHFPAYQDGKEVNYVVTEEAVSGYASTVEYNQSVYSLAGSDIKGYTGVLITNTYTPQTVDIPVKKMWDDNGDPYGDRPDDVTFLVFNKDVSAFAPSHSLSEKRLEGDSEIDPEDDPVLTGFVGRYTFAVSKASEQECVIRGLPKYDDEGAEAHYWVCELSNHYKLNRASNTQWDGENPVEFENAPWTIEPSVYKVWDDGNDAAGQRPESITVGLYRDGQRVATKTLHKDEATMISEDGNTWLWRHVFADDGIPSYTKSDTASEYYGKAIVYTLVEEEPDGYHSEVTYNKVKLGTYIITNHYVPDVPAEPETPTKVVKVHKKWEDNNDADGARPKSITIRLLANGKEVRTGDLSEGTNWECEFTGLDASDENGEAINYEITEDKVYGYTANITSDESEDRLEKTFNITNLRARETSGQKVEDKRIDLVPTGDAVVAIACGTAITAVCGAYIAWRKRR